MANSVVSLCTSGIPAPQRTQYWAQALTTLCGRLHADPFGSATLDGHIDYTTLWRLRLCQIEVSRHRVALPQSWARAAHHPVIKVLFQTYGTSIFEQDGRRVTVSPGDCLAYDVSRPHIIMSEALTKHEVVIIPQELVRQRGVLFDQIPAQRLSARTGAARVAHDFVRSTFNQSSTIAPDCEFGVADALLNLLLLPFSSADAPSFDRTGPNTLRWRAKAFIKEKLSDPDLSIDRISATLGCTKRYLHMVFGAENTTISQYIWQARLENCRRELETNEISDKTFTEIAFSWGFSSSSHFSRLFKKHYGVTPSAIRAQLGRKGAYGYTDLSPAADTAQSSHALRQADGLIS